MNHYLRDKKIKNLLIDENSLKEIDSIIREQAEKHCAQLASNSSSEEKDKFIYFYIIRLDGQGHRIFSIEELINYFQQAKKVERIIFNLETQSSMKTGKMVGACINLTLDQLDPTSSFLTVSSDDKGWVTASFLAIQEALDKYKSKYSWIRTAWTPLIVQITGVASGFILSLWVADKLSPKLSIENPFVICFLFALLIFSNMWTYLNNIAINFLGNIFPNIKFYRSNLSTRQKFESCKYSVNPLFKNTFQK